MSSVDEKRRWGSFDVLEGVLAQLGLDSITASTPAIHGAVYELWRKPEFRSLLDSYVFENKGYYRYSRELQADLDNLEIMDHLTNPNPSLAMYQISPALKDSFARIGPGYFGDAELEGIAALSRGLHDLLQESNAS